MENIIKCKTPQNRKNHILPFFKKKKSMYIKTCVSPDAEACKKIWERKSKNNYYSHISEYKKTRLSILNNIERHKSIDKIERSINVIVNNKRKRINDIQKFVGKKRNLFYMQIKIDEKKKVINDLKDQTEVKRQNLKRTKNSIKNDMKVFTDFIKFNKENTKNALKNTQIQMKQKTVTIEKADDYVKQKISIVNKNKQHIDKIRKLIIYREFFMKLQRTSNKKDLLNDVSVSANPLITKQDLIRFYSCDATPTLLFILNDYNGDKKCDLLKNMNINDSFNRIQDENLINIKHVHLLMARNNGEETRFNSSLREYNGLIKKAKQKKKALNERIKGLKKNIAYLNKVKGTSDEILFFDRLIGRIGRIGIKNGCDLEKGPINVLKVMEGKMLNYLKKIKTIPSITLKKYEKLLSGEVKNKFYQDMFKKKKSLHQKNLNFDRRVDRKNERKHNFRVFVKTKLKEEEEESKRKMTQFLKQYFD